jgi:protein ImuB
LLERAQPAPEQVSTLVARLSALMGDTHVGSPRLTDTWKPGAFAMAPFEVSEVPRVPEVPKVPGQGAEVPSALRRFRFPIPTRVQVQEGRPIRVATDRQGFSSGAIVQSAGPWRTSGEWWQEGQAWDRDEWDVAMADGTIYRLVVERGVGQWFLEGVVD